MEHQDIATVDIPGEFMQEDINEKVIHLQLDEELQNCLYKKHPIYFASSYRYRKTSLYYT